MLNMLSTHYSPIILYFIRLDILSSHLSNTVAVYLLEYVTNPHIIEQ